MKRTLIATLLLLCACASNSESQRLAAQMEQALDAYETQLAQKIREQRAFYRARGDAYADSRLDILVARREHRRAQLAAQIASDMAGSPGTEARAGDLTRVLIEAVAEETELDRRLREEARIVEADLRKSLLVLTARQAEIERVRAALRSLSTNRATREEAKAIIDYAASVQESLDRD